MGTTVVKLFAILLAIFFVGCATRRQSDMQLFVSTYKGAAFYQCMQEITNKKLNGILRESGDNVSFMGVGEVLSTPYSDSAALTAKRFVAQIPPMVPDAEPGHDFYLQKPLLAESLNFYESKRLDSIARQMYRHAKANG